MMVTNKKRKYNNNNLRVVEEWGILLPIHHHEGRHRNHEGGVPRGDEVIAEPIDPFAVVPVHVAVTVLPATDL
jgi:hypothetical protein